MKNFLIQRKNKTKMNIKEIIERMLEYNLIRHNDILTDDLWDNPYAPNILLGEYYNKSRFYLFSYKSMSEKFLSNLENTVFDNAKEMFVSDLSKFNNHLFLPVFKKNNEDVFFYESGTPYFLLTEQDNTLFNILDVINKALVNKNINSPLFYSISVEDCDGIVLLSRVEKDFLIKINTIFDFPQPQL